MAKGNAKINSSEEVPPLQTRLLRSRKRESPSDESSLTDDVQTTVHQKNSEKTEPGAAAIPLQYPLQECAVIINSLHQATESFSLPKQDDLRKEKHTEATNVNVTGVAGQEETTVTNLSSSQLQNHEAPTDKDTKEKTASEDCSRSPNQNHADQLRVSQSISKNSEHSIQGSNGEKPNICISDAKEASVGLPAKKKRRMGSCGLTEKERSHFLQVQNGHNGTESAEKHICDKTTQNVALEENVSLTSVFGNVSDTCVMEQNESKPEPQSSRCGAAHRPESEVYIAATTSVGVECDPGSSGGKSCEAEGISPPVQELTDNLEAHHAEEEEEKHLEDQQLQECKEPTAENMVEMYEKQMNKEQDEIAEVNLTITSDAREEESDNKDTDVVTPPQMSGTSDDDKEEKTADGAEDAASSTAQSGGLNCGSVKLSEASRVPELRHNVDPEDDPAAGPSTEHTQTRDPDDSFGSGCSDYVSDSQLNTIVLMEEKITEKDPDPLDRLEDSSDLICGLIRELSSLNRKVMVAHRELENLRRRSSRCTR